MQPPLVVGTRYKIVSGYPSEDQVIGTFVEIGKPGFFRFEKVTDLNGHPAEGRSLVPWEKHTFTPVSGGRRRKTRKHKRVSRKTRRYRK